MSSWAFWERKMAKTGRKLLDIDAKEVEKLASFGCTNVEIAAFFDCDESTIRKRFSDIIARGYQNGKIRLRKKQIETALRGNVKMLIWLGKQMLDQSDKQSIEHSGKEGSPVNIVLQSLKTDGNDKQD